MVLHFYQRILHWWWESSLKKSIHLGKLEYRSLKLRVRISKLMVGLDAFFFWDFQLFSEINLTRPSFSVRVFPKPEFFQPLWEDHLLLGWLLGLLVDIDWPEWCHLFGKHFPQFKEHVSHEKKPVDIPWYWLFSSDPNTGLLESPHNWVV